jgi:uncharacterized protein YxeA
MKKTIIVVIFLLVVLILGIFFYNKSDSTVKTYVMDNDNTVVGPNTKETKDTFNYLSDLGQTMRIATSTETCRKFEGNGDYTCVVSLALRLKNPKMCEYFTHTVDGPVYTLVNSCLADYIRTTKDMNACSLMSTTTNSDYLNYKGFASCK